MGDYYALAGVFASTTMVNKTADGKMIRGEVAASTEAEARVKIRAKQQKTN